jgi:hypothetical protein
VKPRKLEVLPDFRDENGVPGFAVRRWDYQQKRYVWVAVPIMGDELKTQLHGPVRLSQEPKYWLYRNRFVQEEGANSEPDEFVDLLQDVIANPPANSVAKAMIICRKARQVRRAPARLLTWCG